MDYFVSIGVAALLEALRDTKAVVRIAPKLAKVFVAIERVAEANPTLAAAIEKARARP